MPALHPILDTLHVSDIDSVACIEAQQHLTPWRASSFEDALRCGWYTRALRQVRPESTSGAACLLGYFVAMQAGDDEELLTLTVAPGHVGQGYGRLLLTTLMQEARARGAQRLLLEVRQSNARAIRLYESVGFTISGMRNNYYAIPTPPGGQGTTHENALLMVCTLSGATS